MRASRLAQFPALRGVMFEARNRIWLPKILDVLRTDRRTIIYVGAGHLGGEVGLLSLLDSAGCKVTLLLK
jgi:uncharacterized protein YbaP (TraB family)